MKNKKIYRLFIAFILSASNASVDKGHAEGMEQEKKSYPVYDKVTHDGKIKITKRYGFYDEVQPILREEKTKERKKPLIKNMVFKKKILFLSIPIGTIMLGVVAYFFWLRPKYTSNVPAPEWQKLSPGLNIKHTCDNEACPSNDPSNYAGGGEDRHILIHFNEPFLLARDTARCCCSLCDKDIKARNFKRAILYKCNYYIKGYKVNVSRSEVVQCIRNNENIPTTLIEERGSLRGDEIYSFDQLFSGDDLWTHLEINVTLQE